MGRRHERRGGGFFAPLLLGFGVVTALIFSGYLAFNLLGNPFKTEIKDRTAPVLLTSLTDLSEYHAAQGDFEVLVDVEEDVRWVPAAIAGERTFFIGVGSVDAIVDFSQLDADHVQPSADGNSVTITVPEPTFTEATVDPDRSHVASRKRGLLDRLGGIFSDSPTGERELYQLAEEKMQQAALESELAERAESNTRAMLTGLVQALGYEHVYVVFEPALPA